jgi:Tfp pilus assembly protein PilF
MLGKILLVLTLAQAQNSQPNGVIHGQILIPSAHAAERIQVTVQRSDGPIVARVFSDTQGNYDARGLPPGSYEVIVNVEGYEEVRQSVAIGTGFYGTAIVNIPLNEKEKTIVIKPDGGAADDVIDINELTRKYPKKAVQDYEKGRDELRKGNDAKATELLASVVKLAPDFYAAHNTLGTLYQKAGKYQESESEYRRARELNPKSPEPLVNLGSLLIDEATARAKDDKEVIGKLLDDALDTLEEAIKIKRSAKAYYFLGTAYYRSDFYPEAETNFKQALGLDAHLPAAHLMLANLYMKQRQWRLALEHLDTYLIDNPKAADRASIEDTRTKVAERVK